MASVLGLRAELIPLSVIVADEGVTYRAQCYRDPATLKLHGSVLVSRTDKRPGAALVPLTNTSKTPAVILYPTEENFDHFFGLKSAYHALPGEIVLYRYEDDKFTWIGFIDESRSEEENRKVLVSMLRELIHQCPDRNGKEISASDWAELAAAFKASPNWKPRADRTGKKESGPEAAGVRLP